MFKVKVNFKLFPANQNVLFYKTIATIAVCTLGIVSMYITHGETGIGYATIGLIFIWVD